MRNQELLRPSSDQLSHSHEPGILGREISVSLGDLLITMLSEWEGSHRKSMRRRFSPALPLHWKVIYNHYNRSQDNNPVQGSHRHRTPQLYGSCHMWLDLCTVWISSA